MTKKEWFMARVHDSRVWQGEALAKYKDSLKDGFFTWLYLMQIREAASNVKYWTKKAKEVNG